MIQDDEQLNQTRAAITHLESAIAALKRDVEPLNPKRFALMAEPAVAQIGELRALIDEYVGIKASAQGVLREIDLDGRSFIVRDPDHPGQETRCETGLEAEDLLEIAKESLDHAVIVRGTRRKDSARRKIYPLRVQEIEILDEVIETTKVE